MQSGVENSMAFSAQFLTVGVFCHGFTVERSYPVSFAWMCFVSEVNYSKSRVSMLVQQEHWVVHNVI